MSQNQVLKKKFQYSEDPNAELFGSLVFEWFKPACRMMWIWDNIWIPVFEPDTIKIIPDFQCPVFRSPLNSRKCKCKNNQFRRREREKKSE